MTMAEKKVESIKKEIEKLTKSLERYQGILNKKVDKCVKLNCNWTKEEFHQHRDTDMTDAQWSAWFDMTCSKSNVEDTETRLSHTFSRLERAETELEKVQDKIAEDELIDKKELEWLERRNKKEEDYYKWLEQFKADCLKDGIIIEYISSTTIAGLTKSGKKFSMYLNEGWTERSRHSYTLRVNGSVFFTSGLFATGYRYLRAN